MLNNKKLKAVTLLLVLCLYLGSHNILYAQDFKNSDWGIKAGLSINLGTHFQRLGLMFQGYYFHTTVQVNYGAQAFFNLRSLGPRVHSWELMPNLGAHIYWGNDKEARFFNHEFSAIAIQSMSPWSIGYSMKYYFDSKGTSQATGIISGNFEQLVIATENDIFIVSGEDKFRTGAVTFQYHFEEFSVYLTSLMWTGGRDRTRLVKSSAYPARFGYLDMSESLYGKTSHGTLSFGVKYNYHLKQTVNAEIGIDSEWVRHTFQNILIHDMPFFPKRWNKAQNPHYPMLKEDGMPYLFGEGEKVKPAKLFFQIGANQPIFY